MNAKRKKQTPTRDELLHIGSLITYMDGDQEQMLGDLIYFKSLGSDQTPHGTFEPSLGKVDVTEEEAKLHNVALDKARLDGMDKNCEVGQGSFAYLSGETPSTYRVNTFSGTVISTDVSVSETSITFKRNGKTFRGRRSKNSECFNFRRVS
jgi:hypothetical protein